METYAVLLESWARLPHLAWGEEPARLLGVHIQDVRTRLRRQQGIVWENLDRRRADSLGAFLIKRGYPAGLVKTDDVVRLGRAERVRNADVLPEGLEIVDIYEKGELIESGSFILAQAGWVKERIAVGKKMRLRVGLGGDMRSNVERVGRWHFRRDKEERRTLGWVLNLFIKNRLEYIEILGREFNYDYQPLSGGSWQDRFGILLSDLSKILPHNAPDQGFRKGVGSGRHHIEEATYEKVDDMVERARWLLTMRKVRG